MFRNDFDELEAAVNAADTDALDDFLFPARRTRNPSLSFHAPLMVSAHRLKHLAKIPHLPTDSIVINLEDGVSAPMKPAALRLAALTLSRLPRCDKKLIVRVNPIDAGGEEEIGLLNAFMPDAVRIPKIRTPDDVKRALSLVKAPIEVHLSVETAEAWLALAALRPDPRVTAFYLGALDLFAELGLQQHLIDFDNPAMHYLLSHFLVTSRALGVKPVSFVYQDFRDMDGFEWWLTLERRMGYDAKGCISPDQAHAAMASFSPAAGSLQRAREIVEAFEKARAQGVTGFAHERYGFIDEPVYKGALAVLAKENDGASS